MNRHEEDSYVRDRSGSSESGGRLPSFRRWLSPGAVWNPGSSSMASSEDPSEMPLHDPRVPLYGSAVNAAAADSRTMYAGRASSLPLPPAASASAAYSSSYTSSSPSAADPLHPSSCSSSSTSTTSTSSFSHPPHPLSSSSYPSLSPASSASSTSFDRRGGRNVRRSESAGPRAGGDRGPPDGEGGGSAGDRLSGGIAFPMPPPMRRLSRQRSARTSDEAQAVRVNVLNTSMQDAATQRTTRIAVILLTAVFLPQIIAGAIVLGIYWSKGWRSCDALQIWCLSVITHMSLCLVVDWASYFVMVRRLQWNVRVRTSLNKVKYTLDVLGLLIFLAGNMLIFGDNDACEENCAPVYNLSIALVVTSYLRMFFPCVIVLLLCPIACFCLPCLIRVLGRLADPMMGKGASEDVINSLEETKFYEGLYSEEDAACSICLTDYTENQTLRILPCSHHFCKACADQWLKVNACCPLCRAPITGEPHSPDSAGRATSASQEMAGAARTIEFTV